MNGWRLALTLAIKILIVMVPVASLAQWAEPKEGVLIIRGGCLFDGVSDTRRRNSDIIIRNRGIVEVDAGVDVQQQILNGATLAPQRCA